MPDSIQEYVKLENRFVLLAWMNSLLGSGSDRKVLEDTITVDERLGVPRLSHIRLCLPILARAAGWKEAA